MARSRLRWLRTVLLILFLASAAGIVYLLGFSGEDDAASQVPTVNDVDLEAVQDPTSTEADTDVDAYTVRSTGVRQAINQDGKRLVEIASAEQTVGKDGSLTMVDVTLGLNRDEGRYDIKSDRGLFEEKKGQATLRGNVVVEGPQPFKLWADWLDLINQFNVIVASDGSRFELGNTARGTTTELRVDLLNRAMLMNKGVELSSLPGSQTPFQLDAEVIRFHDERRRIRAEGGVELTQGLNELEALRVSVYLDEFTDRVKFIRGLWDVTGTFTVPDAASTTDGGPGELDAVPSSPVPVSEVALASATAELLSPATVIDYEAMSLALRLDEEGRTRNAELQGTRQLPVLLRTHPVEGSIRSIRAGQLKAEFKAGAIDTAVGVRGMRIEEHALLDADGEPTGEPMRSARAETGTTTFDDTGSVVMFELVGDVEIKDPRATATAARAKMMVLQEMVELVGEPLVQLTSVEGVLRAPSATVNQRLGLLETSGGTRARLDNTRTTGASIALGAAASEDPVYVESAESLFRQEDGGFLFRGGVRAWQGKNLLLCDQLRGERNGGDLSAIGSVRTVWFPERERSGNGVGNTDDPNDGPVEVKAGYMQYLEAEGKLKYEQGRERSAGCGPDAVRDAGAHPRRRTRGGIDVVRWRQGASLAGGRRDWPQHSR